MFDDQAEFHERFEWCEDGLRRLATVADTVVIVDVFSFTTVADVAVARGAIVFPDNQRGTVATAYAERAGATMRS